MDAKQASEYHRFERLVTYWRNLGQACGNHGVNVSAKAAYTNCADALADEIEATKAEQSWSVGDVKHV